MKNMGALYEDVEKFFGDIFAAYGAFLARNPVSFILVSLLTSCLLGMGLLSTKYEQRVEKLYTPMYSQAFKDQAVLDGLFPDRTRDAYYAHQMVHLGTFGEIIVTGRDGRNVLTESIMKRVIGLYDEILQITIDEHDRGHKFTDLCASRNEVCVVDGEGLLSSMRHEHCLDSNLTGISLTDTSGFDVNLHDVLADISREGDCIEASAMRIRFNLKHDTKLQRHLSLLWEKTFLSLMESQQWDDEVSLSYAVSESLDMELAKHLGTDTKYFALTIIMMVIYSSLVSSGGNWVSTRMVLGLAGIVAALLAILAAFGLLSICGLPMVDICGVMPFMVLGLGVDDMFILMSGYRRTDLHHSIEDRMAETFRSSAISVTITSLTNLLAFCIGATSPFLSIKNFCIYAGVAVLICYINQLTFFGGCLALHARRVKAARHCVTCCKIKPRAVMEAEGKSRLEILFCSGQPPSEKKEDDSFCEKIPSSIMPKVLLKHISKFIIAVLFVLYLAISIIGASKIKIGLKLQTIVPESSYLASYYEHEAMYFNYSGPTIMFAITHPLDYMNGDNQLAIRGVIDKALKSEYIDPKSKISWLDTYTAYLKNKSIPLKDHVDFVKNLREFLEGYPQFVHDVKVNSDYTAILASRFFVTSRHFSDSTKEGDMMEYMRELALNGNGTITMTAYSSQFLFYEHYKAILKNTLLAVGVAIIGMLFIALAFIPHPVSISCIAITMMTIVLGMLGFMHFWGLALSAITTVQVILSVGFSVDFTVHISHAFMAATGKNRNERVTVALQKVGVPIMNGAISSILGILMLAFASSYVFVSFFKTMLLVIFLGLAHALLFLPVVLSFIGPKRTNKPKIFIPVSLQCRTHIANPPSEGLSPKPSPNDNTSLPGSGDEKDDLKSLKGYHVADLVDTPEERYGLLGARSISEDRDKQRFKDHFDQYGARPKSQHPILVPQKAVIQYKPKSSPSFISKSFDEYELDPIPVTYSKFDPEGSIGSVREKVIETAADKVVFQQSKQKSAKLSRPTHSVDDSLLTGMSETSM